MARTQSGLDNIKILEKIPIFRGLSVNQVKRLLEGGEVKKFDQDQTLCREGDKSTDLFILTSGEVAVQINRSEIARIRPVELIGEMGVVTVQPRSATVVAIKTSMAIVITKIQFDQILKSDPELAAKLYKNMVGSLCSRLRDANQRWQQGDAPSEELSSSLI